MGPCVMVGDSIAVGVGMYRPECETIARVGISSERYLTTMMPAGELSVETAVISLGVNDDASLDTLNNLREVRARIIGRTVYWLLPGLKERVRGMIQTVAAENGDRLIDTRPEVGRDHLHPTGTGYQRIAARTVVDGGEGLEVAYDEPRQTYGYASGYSSGFSGRVTARGHLTAYATPQERIRRLRALRRGEGGAHASQMHRDLGRARTALVVTAASVSRASARRSSGCTAPHACSGRYASARS